MAIGDDFTIDYVNRRITHSSGVTVYSVNALYSYLMDTFDELDQMDDTVPMSAQTPTDYTLINGWFMDDNSYKYLKGGALKTVGYANEIHVIPFASSTFVAGDIGMVVRDDGANFGTIVSVNATGTKIWVRTGSATTAAMGSTMSILANGHSGVSSAISTTGEDLFPNVYTLGTIDDTASQQIYIIQGGTHLANNPAWFPDPNTPANRHIDVLIKTKELGGVIAASKITIFLRHYPAGGDADLYDHFDIDLTAGGRNAVPLATSIDLNNTSAHAAVSAYNDITIAFVNGTITHGAITGGNYTNYEPVSSTSGGTGIMVRDASGTMTLANVDGTFLNGDTITGATSLCTSVASGNMTVARITSKAFTQDVVHNYSVAIDCAGRTLSEVYEYLKFITAENSVFSTYGVRMQSAALAINKMDGEQYIRAFTDVDTPANSFSPVKPAPFGTFAGGKFFGARGIWVEDMDPADIQAFQLIDADGITRNPPNQQSISITNLIAGDRVSVFRTVADQSTVIKRDIFTAAAGNDENNTTFVVNEDIPSDTPNGTDPNFGILRIVDTTDATNTREVRYTYTSWDATTKTFSGLSPALDRNYPANTTTAYVPYIDATASSTSVAVTVVFSAERFILVRVRRKQATAILPFETPSVFTSTGASISTIRTTDTIVT